VEKVKEWTVEGLKVVAYAKALHCSKNYYNTVNIFKDKVKSHLSIDEAIKYLLKWKKVPKVEPKNIQYLTVYCQDRILALHCQWAPTIFQKRNEFYCETGWYPYVTGIPLEKSQISRENDKWLGTRNFNALEFPNFPVDSITLKDVSVGEGIALLLSLNDFTILLDCCFDIDDPVICPLDLPPNLLFISHVHNDHIKSLERLLSKFEGIPLICSYTTLDLLCYFKKTSKKLQKYFRKNAYPLIFNDLYRINNEISLQIFKAGHYPGASMLYLFTSKHRILYTGDICLYDLQPLKGGGSGIQNLNGPLDSLILEGQFCNQYFPSQTLFLDLACEKIFQTIQNNAPVLILGDPGSWLPIFYLKLFSYLSQINIRHRIYLESHTLEIMKILRYRKEDISPYLTQQILRFHDPFASISRQNLADFNFSAHSPDDPPIILFNSNRYTDPPPSDFQYIFGNPNALLIIAGPIRSKALKDLWKTRMYGNDPKIPLQCHIFRHDGNLKHPEFLLHADKSQIYEIFQHLAPPNIYLFHGSEKYLTDFQNFFNDKLQKRYSNSTIHILQPNRSFTLFDITSPSTTHRDSSEVFTYFFPLIKAIELAKADGNYPINQSQLSIYLKNNFPYWREQVGVQKLSEYITEAEAANYIHIYQENSQTFVALKQDL